MYTDTFYRPIECKFQLSLDTTINGYFKTKSVEDATQLIENLAASNNNCSDYDKSIRGNTSESAQIFELKTKVTQLLKNQQSQRIHVNLCDDVAEIYVGKESYDQEEMNYMGFQNI